MRLFSLLIFYQLIGLTLSFAQKTDTIFLSQKLNDEGFIDASKKTTLFIDSTSKISLENIDNQVFTNLSNFKFEQFSFSYSQYNFWLKLTVINPTDSLINILFTTGIHKSMDVFMKVRGQYQKIQEVKQEWLPDKRPFRFDEKYVPLTFQPNKTYQLLIKVREHPQLYFKLNPTFVSYDWEYEDKVRAFFDEYFILTQDGLYISVLVFVAIYMFIMFFVEGKKYYVYYGFYLFFLVLFSFWAIEHSPYTIIIFSYFPALKFSGNNNTYLLITNIFYFLFHYEFLELPKIAPKFSKVLVFYIKVLISLLIVDTFVNFVLEDYSLGGKIWILTQPIIAIFGIYGTIQLYKLKGPLLRYIQIGSTVLVLGAIFGFLEQLLLIKPANNVIMRLAPSIPFNIGVLIELFCFSTALGYKTWLTQRDRNHLMKSVKESELRTLRSQINPHFVFNSLNSIKSQILQDRSLEASEYLTDFATLMRSILQFSKEKFISLSDELETAVLYIKLEKLRFEEGFDFHYELQEGIDTDEILIPPMLLQPYIENAIKHGLMNKEGNRSLTLSVTLENHQVVISIDDNGIGRERASLLIKNSPKHQSMGININKERIELLSLTNDLHIHINIIDKKLPDGNAAGTKVIIYLPF
ncbi:histidine kinase [Emticicia sp. SJ17W-69]|uniref:histidine kinase n=1 Tax=Emticicia sp. SJ17W-69 TaxID=3421657 RepID=UPI003EBFBA79